jgi:starch phosphorylase
LWAAKPGQEFDLEAFNTGDYVQVWQCFKQWPPVFAGCEDGSAQCFLSDGYMAALTDTAAVQAILNRQRAETLSSVLYPDDRTYQGKELRLKQQHFFVSATVQVGVGAATAAGPAHVTWCPVMMRTFM